MLLHRLAAAFASSQSQFIARFWQSAAVPSNHVGDLPLRRRQCLPGGDVIDPAGAPVGRVEDAGPDEAMKGRVGPTAHGGDMAMLGRILVHAVHVPRIVGIVANHMLPEAALSDATLAAGDTGPGTPPGRRHGAHEAETVDVIVRSG
jgi:hypothetical protein